MFSSGVQGLIFGGLINFRISYDNKILQTALHIKHGNIKKSERPNSTLKYIKTWNYTHKNPLY